MVGEEATAVASYGVREAPAGRLQVTLKAYFQLPLPAHSRRIFDGFSDAFRSGAVRRALHVILSGTVTALAIDSLGDGFNVRVSTVTKQTLFVDLAPEVHVIGPIVTGIHGPDSAILRIPAEG